MKYFFNSILFVLLFSSVISADGFVPATEQTKIGGLNIPASRQQVKNSSPSTYTDAAGRTYTSPEVRVWKLFAENNNDLLGTITYARDSVSSPTAPAPGSNLADTDVFVYRPYTFITDMSGIEATEQISTETVKFVLVDNYYHTGVYRKIDTLNKISFLDENENIQYKIIVASTEEFLTPANDSIISGESFNYHDIPSTKSETYAIEVYERNNNELTIHTYQFDFPAGAEESFESNGFAFSNELKYVRTDNTLENSGFKLRIWSNNNNEMIMTIVPI